MANEIEFANDERAARPTGDGLPIGNELTPMIGASQVRLDPEGV